MVACPHCFEDGIGFWAKLWSDSACPAICESCGNPSYLRTYLMHWTGAALQLLGFIAIIVSVLLGHWWPVAGFATAVVSTYSLIGFRAQLIPISKPQALENKRNGNIFLFLTILVVLLVGIAINWGSGL